MDKTTEVFHFSPLLIGAVFVVGVPLLFAGIRLWRTGRYRKFAWGLIVFGFIAEILLGPDLLNDHITITGHSYSSRTGFWFAPTEREFEFKDVDYITDGYWTDAKGRRHRQWDVHFKSGSILDVQNGTLWGLNQQRIVELLQRRGVQFR